MYKVLVAEDLKWIRKGIIALLRKKEYSFGVILEASDGIKAFEMIQKEKPDIVITDIKMPYMDGLELIKKAKQCCPHIRFVIISGYAEFQYAEQALNMGVEGYILKPIKDDEFYRLVNKTIEKIDANKHIDNILIENDKLKRDNAQLNLEQVLNRFFLDRNIDAKDKNVQETLKYYDITEQNHYILGVINIDGSNYHDTLFKYDDFQLIQYSLKNVIEDIKRDCKIFVFNNYENKNQIMILFYHTDSSLLKAQCDKLLIEIYNKINNALGLSVTIGVSGTKDDLSGEIYNEAREAIQLRLIYDNNQIYRYDAYKTEKPYHVSKSKMKLFQKCLERKDIKNIKILLDDIFDKNRFVQSDSRQIQFIWLLIANMIVKTYECEIGNIMEFDLYNSRIFERFGDLDQLKEHARYIISRVIEKGGAYYVSDSNVVHKVEQYVEAHYMQDISVQEIAGELALSAPYLSKIFKKYTEKTLSRFITEKRIMQACKLLRETQANVSDISISVGYEDIQYFYRVFKKMIGQTPLAYRNKGKKD